MKYYIAVASRCRMLSRFKVISAKKSLVGQRLQVKISAAKPFHFWSSRNTSNTAGTRVAQAPVTSQHL